MAEGLQGAGRVLGDLKKGSKLAETGRKVVLHRDYEPLRTVLTVLRLSAPPR